MNLNFYLSVRDWKRINVKYSSLGFKKNCSCILLLHYCDLNEEVEKIFNYCY